MLRCGLALAGVNTWLKQEKAASLEEFGDGILNGNDVLALRLQDTKLLILSACETALGETKSGEGVKGLRRAFELAGVQSMICTLWRVRDESSFVLMREFYINLLSKNMDILRALSKAKEFIMNVTSRELYNYYLENGLIEEANELKANTKIDKADKKRFSHPHYWAGYIVQGKI